MADTTASVPDLFIIGAAKAGTTSLAAALAAHPDVRMGITKELRFLMDETDPLARVDGYGASGLAGYAKLFCPQRPGSRLLDASPQYYYQETAQSVIPTIKNSYAILMMRDPANRLLSLFNYAKTTQLVLPHQMTFSEFVSEIRKGAESDLVRDRRMLREALEHGQYARYVRTWTDLLGTRRFVPVLFEQFTQDPQNVTQEICDRVGLDKGYYESHAFRIQNPTSSYRSRRLHRFAKTLSMTLPSTRSRALGKSLYKTFNVTRSKSSLTPEDEDCIKQIRREYEPWNQELAELLALKSPIWA